MAKKPTYEELEKRVRDLDKRFREVEMKKEGFIVDSENFFVLADKSPDGITIVDSEGRYLYANRSAAEGLGYDSSEFLKMTFSDLVHPDDRDMVSRKFAERTEGRAVPSIYEARFLHKDGSIVFLEVLGMKTMWDGRPASMVIGRDVTACKRTEKELRDSEARYRSIFKNTGTAMAVIDKNEIITSLNREFEKLTGYRREDLEGKKMLGDLSTPEETRRIRNDSYEKLKLKDGVPRHYETVLVTQKGERRDVLMTVFPIPGSSRQILSLIDITERKTAERQLQESEEKYRSHFENVGDMIFTLDRNLQITSVSPSIRQILGYDPEDFIGKDFSEVRKVINKKEYRISYINANKILGGEIMHLSEYELTARDGRKVLVEITGHPMVKDGRVTGSISVARDITERRVAEKALKESMARYEHLVKHAPAGIYEVDYERERFVGVNDVMCIYTGYTREELMAMKPFDLFADESLPHLYERFAKLQRADEVPDSVEYVIKTKSGEEIWILLSSRYTYEKGKLKRSTGVVYNITERKKAELALTKSEERLRTVLEEMPMMLVAFDETGDIIVWNSESERITGYMLDEADKSTIWGKLFPDKRYRHRLFSEIDKLGNYFYAFEVNLVCSDGSQKIISWSNISDKYPVPGWSFWGVGMDVTEIKEAQAVLEQANVRLEEMVEEKRKELNEKAETLDELNSALKVLVNAREDYRRELEENIVSNFKQLITPYLDVLKKSQLNADQIHYLGILENYMNEIISPFARDLSSRSYNLTPQEIRVAGLIKDHRTTKEIARLLHVSQSAVIFHRHNIRKKLDLIDKKVNLESYLRSFV